MYQFRSGFDTMHRNKKKGNSSLYQQSNSKSSSGPTLVGHVGYQLEGKYCNQDKISEESSNLPDNTVLLSKDIRDVSERSHKHIKGGNFKNNQGLKWKTSQCIESQSDLGLITKSRFSEKQKRSEYSNGNHNMYQNNPTDVNIDEKLRTFHDVNASGDFQNVNNAEDNTHLPVGQYVQDTFATYNLPLSKTWLIRRNNTSALRYGKRKTIESENIGNLDCFERNRQQKHLKQKDSGNISTKKMTVKKRKMLFEVQLTYLYLLTIVPEYHSKKFNCLLLGYQLPIIQCYQLCKQCNFRKHEGI